MPPRQVRSALPPRRQDDGFVREIEFEDALMRSADGLDRRLRRQRIVRQARRCRRPHRPRGLRRGRLRRGACETRERRDRNPLARRHGQDKQHGARRGEAACDIGRQRRAAENAQRRKRRRHRHQGKQPRAGRDGAGGLGAAAPAVDQIGRDRPKACTCFTPKHDRQQQHGQRHAAL